MRLAFLLTELALLAVVILILWALLGAPLSVAELVKAWEVAL